MQGKRTEKTDSRPKFKGRLSEMEKIQEADALPLAGGVV